MNGRELFRQTSAKQTNAQHKLGTRPNSCSRVQVDARCLSSRKAVSAKTATMPKTTINKRLNIQPTISEKKHVRQL